MIRSRTSEENAEVNQSIQPVREDIGCNSEVFLELAERRRRHILCRRRELRDQLEVNLFGVFHVTQAFLPVLRGQGGGHIIQISTIGGITTFPSLGGYHASKWAVEGMTEALAQEVADFGIKVTLVEPGAFKTDWSGSSAVRAAGQQQYDSVRAKMAERSKKLPANFNGNPAGVGPAILQIVDADDPPLRVLFGLMPTVVIPGVYEQRLKLWKQWESVSLLANGN